VAVDLDEVRLELYGLPLDSFTAARNSWAKQLKADGEPEAARQVQGFKKPSVAAWLANQLVRREPEQVALLLDLGREMRAGMTGLSADELRLLTKRRYQLVSALVNTTLGYAGPRRPGGDVPGDVQATLEATLADPDSADAFEHGCLVAPLRVSGFGLPSRPDVVPDDDEPGPGADVVDIAAHRERRAKALEAARARVEKAQASADQADERRAQLEQLLEEAEAAEREAAAEVRRLETSLERANNALAKRADVTAQAREELEEADEEADDAHEELADAKDAEHRLDR
jgi:flagellar biosynthesis GTPase FlhF